MAPSHVRVNNVMMILTIIFHDALMSQRFWTVENNDPLPNYFPKIGGVLSFQGRKIKTHAKQHFLRDTLQGFSGWKLTCVAYL